MRPPMPEMALPPTTAAATIGLISYPFRKPPLDRHVAEFLEQHAYVLVQFRAGVDALDAAALQLLLDRAEEAQAAHAPPYLGRQPEDVHARLEGRAVVQARLHHHAGIADEASALTHGDDAERAHRLKARVARPVGVERHAVLVE